MSETHLTLRIAYEDRRTVTMSVLRTLTCQQLIALIKQEDAIEIEALAGFPLRPLPFDETPLTARVSNNETIRVRTTQISPSPVSSSAGKRKKKDAVDKSVERARKIAAKAALNSPSSSSLSVDNPRGVERSIARAVRAQSKNEEASSRLGDFGRQKQSLKRKRRVNLTSEEDIGDSLIAAATGSSGSKSKFLRAVYRRAVAHQYDERKADARCAAGLIGSFSSSFLGEGRLRITYSGGDSRRATQYADEVTLYSKEVLKLALQAVVADSSNEGRELLKPVNMARASPRTFWSLLLNCGGDFESALRTMFPDIVDWTFLSERKRTLSAKAQENLEQQRPSLQRASKVSAPTDANISVRSSVCESEDSLSAESAVPSVPKTETLDFGADDALSKLNIVPEQWLEVLTSLGCVSISQLASLEAWLRPSPLDAIRSASPHTDRERGPLTFETVDGWIAAAQSEVMNRFWKCALAQCLQIDDNRDNIDLITSAHRALKYDSVRKIAPMRVAPEILLTQLIDKLPQFNKELSLEGVRRFCTACSELCQHSLMGSWVVRWEPGEYAGLHDSAELDQKVEEDVDDEREASLEELLMEGWTKENEYVGRKVRVTLEDEESTQCGGDKYIVGEVWLFLPATDDEPMALWKVILIDGRRLDLEMHELVDALQTTEV